VLDPWSPLRRSTAYRIFTAAGIFSTAIAPTCELAGSRPSYAFHLPSAAADLILIRTHGRTIRVRSRSLLIVVRNLIPAIKRRDINPPSFGSLSRHFTVHRIRRLFGRHAIGFPARGTFSLHQYKHMAVLITCRNTLLNVRLATRSPSF
jgi:hypothetical protein